MSEPTNEAVVPPTQTDQSTQQTEPMPAQTQWTKEQLAARRKELLQQVPDVNVGTPMSPQELAQGMRTTQEHSDIVDDVKIARQQEPNKIASTPDASRPRGE